jgi:hypothetical protein
MKRPERAADGTYTVKGKKYKELFGSREQVMNGTAYKTEGLLTIDDLVMNKRGRIVSKKKYISSKKEMRLEQYGYGAKKGKFGYVRIKGQGNGKGKGKGNGKSMTKKVKGKGKEKRKGGTRKQQNNVVNDVEEIDKQLEKESKE